MKTALRFLIIAIPFVFILSLARAQELLPQPPYYTSNAKVKQLYDEYVRLVSENQTLKAQLASAGTSEELAALKAQLAQGQTQIAALQAENTALKDVRADVLAKLAALLTAQTTLQNSINAVQTSQAAISGQVGSTLTAVNATKTAVDSTLAATNTTRTAVTAVQTALSTAPNSASIASQNTALQTSINAAITKLDTLLNLLPPILNPPTKTQTSFTLTWTDNSTNETGFRIERRYNGGAWTEIATVGANVVTYVNSGLQPGSYEYRVRAYNSAGNSGYSNTATGTL